MNSYFIQEKIIKTLLFFSIRFRPLNLKELNLYLYTQKPVGTNLIKNNLDILIKANKIILSSGYYFLAKNKSDFNRYQKQYPIVEKNWRKAIFTAKILRFLPYVRMLAVINSLSFNVANSHSDIDLFIVSAPNRLYIARTFIILVLKLFGLYKNRKNIGGRLCLGFYITEKNLNLEKIALKPFDPYFYFWLASLTPLWGIEVYKKFIYHNKWINKYFANFSAQAKLDLSVDKIIDQKSSWIQKAKEIFFLGAWGDFWEKILSNFHIKHTMNLPENRSKSSTTIAEKNILKLHAADRRLIYKKQFIELTLRLKR